MKTTIKLIALFCCLFAATSTLSAQNKTEKLVRYHGMVDIGSGFLNTFNITAPQFQLTTTHGIDITPYFFIGIGSGIITEKCSDLDSNYIPVYSRFRGNLALPGWRVYPFIETDFGIEVFTKDSGLNRAVFAYNTALGVKLPWKRGGENGIALTIGYGMTKRAFLLAGGETLYGLINISRWSFKLSFDF